jgi:hypothetical protein
MVRSTCFNAGGYAMSNTSIDIFYHNVRGLRTKFTELFDNVILFGNNIFCLTETWLNDQCYDQNLFPDGFVVFRSDRIHATKKRGGGVLIAVSPELNACKRRHDLQFFDECLGRISHS